MSANNNLYDKITVPSKFTSQDLPGTKTYKGFSTISEDSNTFALFDLDLIKQDLINHFHIRQGERLENPTFGTIIWDMLFEPLVPAVKELIVQDVQRIINNDPRIAADAVYVTAYETGLQIDCRLTYLPYNIAETLRMRFDEQNGLSQR